VSEQVVGGAFRLGWCGNRQVDHIGALTHIEAKETAARLLPTDELVHIGRGGPVIGQFQHQPVATMAAERLGRQFPDPSHAILEVARAQRAVSSIVTSATGSIITGCSSGSISHGGSGRGTIAALPSKIGMAFKPARVADCTAARRQKPSSNSSNRWAFETCQSFCAAGIPEDRVGSTAPTTRDSLLRQKAVRRYPIRKVTTPVPVEGGVAGGALPKRAGTSFHGRRKPNGSVCHRRTMAGVQHEAKHAMSAMSPLKSWDVEKPQPQR